MNCPIRTEHKGTVEWRLDGKLHREDGPAVEGANGTKYWYINGLLHREDGPAIEYADGEKRWYINGNLHREDGPAIEMANKSEWWLNGTQIRPDLTKKTVLKISAHGISQAIATGIKLETIERANDKVYEAISQILIERLGVDKDKLAAPIMKEAILTMIPLFIHPVAVAMDGKVAYAKWAKDYAETSIQVSSKRNLGVMMNYLSSMIKTLYETDNPMSRTVFESSKLEHNELMEEEISNETLKSYK